ncbi:DUF4142 domain-containing protein [Lichenihabitans sp. Uapishka_5]|uniref:DUF4142 domain-containing protein n=1 Tax=Lichenihabitans sp. Uapishka_5 TaxID=3037302 RepID=UPI0029E80CAF|nr:DUF4142 domain-containing protein [Lichenihabitans sp. Uapishka_5]MDX7951110.1 DUF4142 domain-containing protein [Lichenihabitans sp. Uapishka_5]
MTRAVPATLALLLAALPFTAQAADRVSDADKAFVAMVSQGGMFEVALGTVAAQQGSTQDIKDQGTTEAHDHALVGDTLKSITAAAKLDVAVDLDAAFTKKLDALKALSGPAFDKAYLLAMEDIHAKDGAAFAKEAKGGSDQALRAFASETHRIVERHIGELKAIGPVQ